GVRERCPEPASPVAHLRGDEHLVAHAAQGAPDQLLAAPLGDAVGVGGVEEVDPDVVRPVERRDGLLVVDLAPLPPDTPRAETDRGDLPSCRSECAVLHRAPPCGPRSAPGTVVL